MANEINVSAKMVVSQTDLQALTNGNSILSLSSSTSYFATYPQQLNSGSWTSINQGQAVNIQYWYVYNNSPSGSIINLDRSGSNVGVTSLRPGDFILLKGSGSNGLVCYANGTGSNPSLQIGITE